MTRTPDAAPDPPSERPLVDAALAQVRAVVDAPLPVLPGYELERELHRGGQGVVYLARRSATGQEVAVKLLREELASDAARARFEREVAVLAGLRHPALVAIHDCGVHAGRSYLVMDHVPGRDLDRELAARERTLREKVELLARVAEAVAAAHQRGVLHRDLKPSNVRIDPEGNAVLLDFGLAKWLREEGVPTDASAPGFVGSAPWASPEQVAGAPLDARSDVYSLGVLAYQALTGTFPYDVSGALADVFEAIRSAAPAPPRERAPELAGDIDRDLETILLCALAKDPERRYASALDFARDLRHWLAGEPVSARRASATYVLAKAVARHRLATATAIGVLALVVASVLSVRASRGRWRDAARQLDAKVHAEYVRRVAEADRAGDGVALAGLLAAPPTERVGFALAHLRARFARAAWTWREEDERPLAGAFSPDGTRLAIGTWEGGVRVFSAEDGRPLWEDPEALAEVRALDWDVEGRRLLAVESRALVELDARNGELLRKLEWPRGGLELLSVGASRVLIGGHGGAFALVRRASFEVVRAGDLRDLARGAGPGFSGDARQATYLLCAVHADTTRVAAAGSEGIQVWDAFSGERLCSIPIEISANVGVVSALAFSSDGGLVGFGRYPVDDRPGSLHVHDARTGDLVGSVENLDQAPTRLILAPRAASGAVEVWTGTRRGALRRIELPSGRTNDVLPGFGHAVDALAAGPGGTRLATIGREVRTWRLDARAPAPATAVALAAVEGVGWVRARTTKEGVARIEESGEERMLSVASGVPPRALALGGGAGGLVAGWASGVVRRFGPDGELAGAWEFGSSVGRVAMGGGRLIAALDDGTVVELAARAEPPLVLEEGSGVPTALAIDAARVAVARGHELSILGARRLRLEAPARERITALTWLAGEDSLAVGSSAGSLWILALGGRDGLERGEFLADLARNSRAIEALAYDAEARVLGCVTSDGVLELRAAR